MKYTYKKVLKILHKEYYSNHCSCSEDWEICRLHSQRKDVEKSFDILCAKDYVSIVLSADNEIVSLSLKDRGILHYINRREKLFHFWLPVSISIVSLISSFRYDILKLMEFLCSK